MKILGLTGSIATGKTFVADIFIQSNIAVFSSDLEVAKLLKEQNIIDKIKQTIELSSSITKDGLIDKKLLANIVFSNIGSLQVLENILHPLIEEKIKSFIGKNKSEKIILLDIPLLFEKHYQSYCSKIITTFCNEETQKERAFKRNNIDNKKLSFIIKQQMPSNLKAALTDYLVYTDISSLYTKKQVEQILLKELV